MKKSIFVICQRMLFVLFVFLAFSCVNVRAESKGYALLIGTEKSTSPNLTLMEQIFKKYAHYPVTDSRCKKLCKNGIEVSDYVTKVKNTFKDTSSKDVSYVYFNGHSPASGEGFGSFSDVPLNKVFYPYDEFLDVLCQNIKGKIVLFVDSCYSEYIIPYAENCSAKDRITVFASSSKTEGSRNSFPKKVTGSLVIDTIIAKVKNSPFLGTFTGSMAAVIERDMNDYDKLPYGVPIKVSALFSRTKKFINYYAKKGIIYGQTPQKYSANENLKLFSVTQIKLNKTAVTMQVKKTCKLTATLRSMVVTPEWKSSNPSIAKVNSKGKVTALKPGTVTITATDKYSSATCKVTVKKAPSAPAVVASKPYCSPTQTMYYTEQRYSDGVISCDIEHITSWIYIGGKNTTTKIVDAYCDKEEIYVIGKPEDGLETTTVKLHCQMTSYVRAPISNGETTNVTIIVKQNNKEYTLKCKVTFVKQSVFSKIDIGGKDYTEYVLNRKEIKASGKKKIQVIMAKGFKINKITIYTRKNKSKTISNGATIQMNDVGVIYVEYSTTKKPANYSTPNYSGGTSDQPALSYGFDILNYVN